MAHNAGGPGVSEEKHRGPGGFPPDVPAGWSGAVPAPGATQSRDGGQSKWIVGGRRGHLLVQIRSKLFSCLHGVEIKSVI